MPRSRRTGVEEPPASDAFPAPRGIHPRAVGSYHRPLWWSTFLLFAAAMSLWALALPTFASPDEPAHVIKSAAVARGQLLGYDVHTPAGDTITFVEVPAAQAGEQPCFAHRARVSAACQEAGDPSTELISAGTLAGHYQPLYYAIVGLGSLVFPGPTGLYVMRLLSALLSASLLASALQSARMWRNGLGALGLMVAVTPMSYFLGGGVNPSGLEITAAIGTWTSMLALLAAPLQADRRLIARVSIAASALVLSRSLSPLWLAVVGVVIVVATGTPALRRVLKRVDVRVGVAITLVCTLAATAWIVSAGALTLRPNRTRKVLPLPEILGGIEDRFGERARQMVGNFGWLDTPLPDWIYLTWAAFVVLLLLAFLLTGGLRRVVALTLLLGAIVVLPAAIEASQQNSLGFVWQGRYTMPLSVGVPLLLAYGIEQTRGRLSHGVKFATTTVLVGVVSVAQVVAFWVNLHRYTVGVGNPGGLFHLTWSPPVAAPLLLGAFAAAQLALAAVVVASSRITATTPSAEGEIGR